MYLRKLHIQNLRLIRDLELSFVDDSGEPRMWTVLIGRNATGKTSILQAIALAAVGHLRANLLPAPRRCRCPIGVIPMSRSPSLPNSALGASATVNIVGASIPAIPVDLPCFALRSPCHRARQTWWAGRSIPAPAC